MQMISTTIEVVECAVDSNLSLHSWDQKVMPVNLESSNSEEQMQMLSTATCIYSTVFTDNLICS